MKKIQFKKLVLAMGAGAVVLTGCAGIHKQVAEDVKTTSNAAQEAVRAAEPLPPTKPLVQKVKAAWFSDKSPMLEVPKAIPLPDVFQKNFVNTSPGSVRVVDLMTRISKEMGVQVRLAPEVIENQVSDQKPTAAASGGGDSASLPPIPGGLPGAPSLSPSGTGVGSSSVASGAGGNGASSSAQAPSLAGLTAVRLSDLMYDGPLNGFLDLLASKMQVSWKYEKGQVVLYRYETRVYNIKALAGIGTTTSGVGASTSSASGQGSGGGGTSSSTNAGNRTDMKMATDLWGGIGSSIRVMLSPYGRGNFFASSDLGTITISDEPSRLERVESYIEKLNKDLSKQVSLNITVYNVEVSDEDQVGVDWTAMWGTAASKFGFAVGGSTSFSGPGALSQTQNIGVNILKGPWTDSKFILGALNSVGKASLVTRGQMITLNRQAAPLQVVDETTYVSKVSTTVSQTSTQTSIESSTVVTGFSTTVTPKIEDDGDVLLQFAGGLSDLKGLKTFTAGTSSVQLPSKTLRDFLQRVKMRSGETLALAGFEQVANNSTDSGVGDSKNLLLGGQQYAKGKRLSIVILITPYVIE
jgi:type IVB pilus formation R64 PilN family outer membrane protein